jgi:hypothetical protein
MSYITARLAGIHTKPPASAPITEAVYRTGEEMAADLNDAQRYGLLVVRGGEAAGKLRAVMDAMGWPAPGDADWHGLRRLGLVQRRRDSLYHDLLPKGLTAATAITRDLCRKFNVHVLYVQERKPGVARNGHCSCGLMRHTEIHGTDGRVEAKFSHHVAQMRRDPGGYESERRQQAIIDSVAEMGAEAWHQFQERRHA